MTPVHRPPYSPDLTPGDFFLFPQMKNVLKGKHFANEEEVKQKPAKAPKVIRINEFQKCFEQGEKSWLGVLRQK